MCFRYVGVDAHAMRMRERLEALRDRFEEVAMPGDRYPGDRGEYLTRDGEVVVASWGLQPPWATDPRFGRQNAYNARAETVAVKPTFRTAFRHRRCLVPASAFYERAEGRWLRVTPRDAEAFSIAGLFEPPHDLSPEGSFTMVTTEPNDLIAPVNDRMPVLLEASQAELWISPTTTFDVLKRLMIPCSPGRLTLEDAGPVERRKKAAAPSLFDEE